MFGEIQLQRTMDVVTPGSLVGRIGSRTVLIDANLPVQLTHALRRKGMRVRHVFEMDPDMSDTYVQILMFDTDVLITRDRNLRFKVGRTRCILLPAWMDKKTLLATVEASGEQRTEKEEKEEHVKIYSWLRETGSKRVRSKSR